jgi:hypothetical protein
MSGIVVDSVGRIVASWAPNRWDLVGLWQQRKFATGRVTVGDLTCWFSIGEVS